jgi:threonine synthase
MDCEQEIPYLDETGVPNSACSSCSSTWLEARYDFQNFKRELLSGLPGKPTNLWRYQDVLPIADHSSLDLLSAGGTPLQHSNRYGKTLGHDHVYIKDERHGPTSSFKDRQAAVAVAAMIGQGIKECVIASTGNAAVAYAAACARAGIKLWVFTTSQVPHEKMRETALFGAEVVRVSGNYDQTKQIASDFATRRGLIVDRGAQSLPSREAFKTIAYEIVEQLGWRAPDWYIQAVSGGLGPMGIYQGFKELQEMGLIDKVPALGIVQSSGCAPMVHAFKAGKEVADPVVPQTLIAILATGDPGKTYTQLFRLIERYGGTIESVEDAEAFKAMHVLAQTEGMAVEPAAAVAFAGLEKMIKEGQIGNNETVVVNCSGHTFPVEKHVLGDQWEIDVHLSSDQTPAPHEGLLSALDHLDEKTTTVLLVDDNPDDALMLRRVLEARKSYRVFYASDGQEGLRMAQKKTPDLIVMDLMMPTIDGFGMLEALKEDERTRQIPVMVVSAKDLSSAERKMLTSKAEGIYQKGSLPPTKFVDQVVEVITQKSNDGV